MAGKKTSKAVSKPKKAEGGLVNSAGDISGLIASLLDNVNTTPEQKANLAAMVAEKEKMDKRSGAVKVGKTAASGAAIGTAIAPGIGTLIGGGLGAAAGLVGNLLGREERLKETEAIIKNANAGAAALAAGGGKRFGYKNGGKVKGPGTAKSDSIPAKVQDGSFVVPAENASLAMELGQRLLGWKSDEKATVRKSGNPVDLSNGEVIFDPDEVMLLENLGIDLGGLAPNAEPGSPGKASGGFEIESLRNKTSTEIMAAAKIDQLSKQRPNLNEDPLSGYIAGALAGIDKDLVGQGELPIPGKIQTPPIITKDAIPQILAGSQVIAGALGIATTPDPKGLTVSTELNQAVSEARSEAEYGFTPEELNSAKRSISRNTARAINMAGSEFAGSPASSYNRTVQLMHEGNESIADLLIRDAELKRMKKAEARGLLLQKGARKDYIQEFDFRDQRSMQESMAGVAMAGLDNIIGAREYQKMLESKKNRDNLNNNLI